MLPPVTPHYVSTMLPAVVKGYFGYTVNAMSKSIGGILEDVCNGELISNSHHFDICLCQIAHMALYWSDCLRFDPPADAAVAAEKHLPFIYSCQGLLSVVSVCSFIGFAEILHPLYYSTGVDEVTQRLCIKARAASSALLRHLSSHIITGDDLVP